jgi:hypothetical protein
MTYVRSVEASLCAACGELITNTERVTEGVICVLDRAGPRQLHPRCVEWSTTRSEADHRSAEAPGANLSA